MRKRERELACLLVLTMTFVGLRGGMNFLGMGTNRGLGLGRNIKSKIGMRAYSRRNIERRELLGVRAKNPSYELRFDLGSKFFNSGIQRRALLTTSYSVGPSTVSLCFLSFHFSTYCARRRDRE